MLVQLRLGRGRYRDYLEVNSKRWAPSVPVCLKGIEVRGQEGFYRYCFDVFFTCWVFFGVMDFI